MDLRAAVGSGIKFMTHKATEGTSYVDARFGDFCNRAHNVVPLLGSYHVLHSGSINAQVDNFLGQLRVHAPWWQSGPFIIQLDVEHWPQDFPSPADVDAWCNRFRAVTGGSHQVVVYASAGQYGNRLGGSCPLWNARYGSSNSGSPQQLYPGDRGAGWGAYSGRVPTIWQFTSNGHVGSQPQCDVNAYRGSLDQLKALVWPRNGGFLMALDDATQKNMAYTLLNIPDPAGGAGRVPLHAWCAAQDKTIDAIAAKSGLTPDEVASIRQAATEGAQAGALASADALVAAVLAGLQGKVGLTEADVEAAVRAVFASAAT